MAISKFIRIFVTFLLFQNAILHGDEDEILVSMISSFKMFYTFFNIKTASLLPSTKSIFIKYQNWRWTLAINLKRFLPVLFISWTLIWSKSLLIFFKNIWRSFKCVFFYFFVDKKWNSQPFTFWKGCER